MSDDVKNVGGLWSVWIRVVIDNRCLQLRWPFELRGWFLSNSQSSSKARHIDIKISRKAEIYTMHGRRCRTLTFRILNDNSSASPQRQSTLPVSLDNGLASSTKIGTHLRVMLTVPRKDLTSDATCGLGNSIIFLAR